MTGSGLLDYTFAGDMAVDIVRLAVIFAGGCVVALAIIRAVGWRHRSKANKREFAATVVFVASGSLAALQEANQIGQPVVWWRLPLLAVIVAGALYVVFTDDAERKDYRPSDPGGTTTE